MTTRLNDIALDLPPELTQYRDEGCELSRSCLNCPLPQCIHDVPGGKGKVKRNGRDAEVMKLFLGGLTVARLAARFEVSERTVYRILKRYKKFSPSPYPLPVEGEGT